MRQGQVLGAEPRAPPLGPSPALMSAEPSGKRPFQLHLEALKRMGGHQPGCWGLNLPSPCWDSAPHFAAGVDKEQQEAEQTHPRAPGTHLTGTACCKQEAKQDPDSYRIKHFTVHLKVPETQKIIAWENPLAPILMEKDTGLFTRKQMNVNSTNIQ